MKFRKLLAGAVVSAPFFASGALAQTSPAPAPSTTPAASPSAPPSAPSGAPASPFMPSTGGGATPTMGGGTTPTTGGGTTQTTGGGTTPTIGAGSPPQSVAPAASTPAASPIPVVAPARPKPKKVVPPPPPLETALSSDPAPTFQSNTFFATAKASERYGAIVDAGGWPTDIVTLHPGAKGPAVAELRKRLAIEGDLDASHARGQNWDAELTAAVKRFQARVGLKQTGVVAGATLKAINVPAKVRFNELASSANRLAGVNFPFDNRYVVVNLPSTSVEAIENDRVVRRYVAIVGDPEHPSPEISAHIQVINLNPTWTVPTSIIRREIIPRMQRDPGYLTRAKIRILDSSGQEINPKSVNWNTERAANYTLRQDSGAGNSLGTIRIGMPNKLAVYMHDTPSKALFGADYRFLSHGCVRVQGVFDLAEWLLQGTGGGPSGVWDKAAMQEKVKERAPYDIKLTKATPVIWVYLTGWSNGDGPANFRDDVYGLDTVGEAQANAGAAPLQ
jgi:murein L,D-transpeptidase YcbB/YkuD